MSRQGFLRVGENVKGEIVITYADDRDSDPLYFHIPVRRIIMSKRDAITLRDAIHSLWEDDENWD